MKREDDHKFSFTLQKQKREGKHCLGCICTLNNFAHFSQVTYRTILQDLCGEVKIEVSEKETTVALSEKIGPNFNV